MQSMNVETGIVGSNSSRGKRKWVPKCNVHCEMKKKLKRIPQVGYSSSGLVMKM